MNWISVVLVKLLSEGEYCLDLFLRKKEFNHKRETKKVLTSVPHIYIWIYSYDLWHE